MTDSQVEAQVENNAEGVQKLTDTKAIIAYLVEKFPLCFIAEGEAKPLKIGLFQDLAEALKDDLAELERIQALFNKLKEPEPRIESYYQKLQRRCDEGKTSIKSVRLALQPAIDLISVNNITDYPTQDQLNQYLVEKSGQTAAITSFINHLRNTIESLKSIISGFSKLRLNSLKNIVLSA